MWRKSATKRERDREREVYNVDGTIIIAFILQSDDKRYHIFAPLI